MFERFKREEVHKGLFRRYLVITDRIALNLWECIVFKADRNWAGVKVVDRKQGFLPAQLHYSMVKKWGGKKYGE